jgi:hypothetical protein
MGLPMDGLTHQLWGQGNSKPLEFGVYSSNTAQETYLVHRGWPAIATTDDAGCARTSLHHWVSDWHGRYFPRLTPAVRLFY